MKKRLSTRLLAVLLTLSILCGYAVPASAAHTHSAEESLTTREALTFEQVENSDVTEELLNAAEETESEQLYADTDPVRVSIILDGESTIEAGFSTMDIATNAEAMAYRERLSATQADVTASIQKAIGGELDVRWNLTLAANIISANVLYGQIAEIEAVQGVKEVILENRYEPAVVQQEETVDPNMSTSGEQIGSLVAWANGYTGAGRRIAVIDTGVDTDHQSFAADAYQYSLVYQAGKAGMDVDEYIASLDLLDAEEIASVLDKLNREGLDAESLYVNSKIPFGYNYIDADYDITHDNDYMGEHGSHVTGIAAANAYIPASDGGYSKALTSVLVQGVAPDAQIITMKVFGKSGGAYDSDYMAAIEDAIILGCDAVNLSLGTVYPGFAHNDTYAELLESLQQTDTVVVTSASNNSGWATNDNNIGYLYGDEVNFNTAGAPGTHFNTLSVASVDNAGTTGYYFQIKDSMIFYNEYIDVWGMQSILTIAGEHEYIFIDGIGSEEDFAAVADVLAGKIAFCSRGTNSFYEKANAAVANGAIATIIYNNQPGTINMSMAGYQYTNPAVSITQSDGALVKSISTPVTDDEGNVLYYTGKMTIGSGIASGLRNSEYETISTFSSWGVPGTLTLKPEITAPGGNIYSVYGSTPDGGGSDQYENMSGTSMAAPQVSGMIALLAQYIREQGLEEKTDLTVRGLAQSLLMSTATPIFEEEGGNYYPVIRQGSGLANVGDAISANTYIKMDENATDSYADGKVKVELGDDPERTGEYSFSFTLNDLSGKGANYTLSSDFFTQAIFSYEEQLYLDTLTVSLPVDVTYTVNGQVFVPTTDYDCDLDHDGDTDADDAQIILNHVSGILKEIDAVADLDGNGSVTSYDAYLLLANMETASFTVPQNGSVKITVQVKLTDSAKAYLDTYYVNGAYVQGYVYVNPQADAEGAMGDVTHSVPVLGFYGNWSDPSMYEDVNYTDYLYGDTKVSHSGVYETNNLMVKYTGSATAYFLTGNPYFVDETFDASRLAINSRTSIYQYRTSLIRAAAAAAVLITDENGEILYCSDLEQNLNGAYYYTDWGMWYDSVSQLIISTKLMPLGVQENDIVNITAVAIPEYYRDETPIDAERLVELVESGVLGDGCYMTTTLKVDNTAPEVSFIAKDLETGNLVVQAQDNNYLSAVLVYNEAGTELLASMNPGQAEAAELVTTVVDLTDVTVRERCMVVVADYANNKSTYIVEYGGEPEDFSGRMYAFRVDANRGTADTWMEIDPEGLYWCNAKFNGGVTNLDQMNFTVVAAEYVGGYVFMADEDGNIFVAKHNDWSNYIKVGNTGLTGKNKAIYDMAYNYSDNQLYALGYNNTIYTIDINTGLATKQYTVSIKNPEDSDYTDLGTLAIDGEGNFYSINLTEDDDEAVFLYSWTKALVSDGEITKLQPVNKKKDVGFYSEYDCPQSLAWDHTTNTLYWANADYKANNYNYLLIVNTTTGKGSRANTNKNYSNSTSYDARLYDRVNGLYIVPAEDELVPGAKEATGIDISETTLSIYRGQSWQLKAYLFPWTLEDQTVTWSTADASVAIVDENGKVKGTGTGTTTITATSNASPDLSVTCTVTVEEMDAVEVNGVVKDAEGNVHWAEISSSAPSQWTSAEESTVKHLGGAMMEGKIITHDGKFIYAVDPDSFETTNLGVIASSWLWSDAVEMPGKDYLFGKTMLAGICNDGQYLEVLDPYAGSLSYFNFSEYFDADPMATIVYWGEGYQSGRDTQKFLIMTEQGRLYEIEIWVFAIFINANVTLIGETGLEMLGAASARAGLNASMIYDEATGKLILAASDGDGNSNLYAIDPDNMTVIDFGTFGDGVSPVASLYQYDRITELTVLLNTYKTSVYEKEQVQLTADVKPWYCSDNVTWASSDTSIATVDQNGLVTAVSAGTVNITATSADVDEEGNPAVGTCEVTVLPLVPVNIDLHAQIETATGEYQWIGFNTASIGNVTVEATTNQKATAGTGHNGLIYAETADGLVKIDPKNGYSSTTPVSDELGDVFLDMTTAPTLYYSGAYVPGIGATPALSFGQPVFVSEQQVVGIFIDYDTAQTFNFSQYGSVTGNLQAAICYVGKSTLNTAPAQAFAVLGTDGNLYRFLASPMSWNSDGESTMYAGSCTLIGNIGMTFSDRSKLTMTYVSTETQNGYLIADSSSGNTAIYFVNIANGTMKTDLVGRVPGAVDLTALYTDADMNRAGDTLDANPDFAVWDGTATRASSVRHVAQENCEVSYSQTTSVEDLMNGTTDRFVKEPAAVALNTGAETGENTVALTITEDETTTNGLYEISYDPAILTYSGIASVATLTSVNVDETAGKITFAYATKTAMAAETAVATVNFTYTKEYIDTTVTVRTLERNDVTVDETDTERITYEVGGHNYEVTEAQEATCLEGGYRIYTCTRCGDSYREELNPLGHDYAAVVTAPTCTEIGYTTYTCTNCGDSYMDDKVEPLGHDYEAAVTAPTCTEAGYTTYTCKVCGDSYVADYISAKGHTFGQWETVTAPGCETKGQEKRTCECGETEYRDIDPTGHSYEAVVTDPTCTEKGYTTYTCACGDSYVSDLTPAKGHNYEAVVTEPTCTESGYTTYTCVDCGDSYITDVVDPIAHDYEDVVVDPTCTEYGYTNHVCTVCGDSYATDYVPATGHTFGEWIVTTEPDCTEVGEETRYCADCDATETREIPAYCPAEDFSDLDTERWYHEGVCFALRSGLMNGMSETVFAPNANMTRAQLVTVLYRLASEPSVEGLENPFTDVAADAWYADAVIWAANEGIVNGMSKTVFAPGANISREQLVTILYRFNGETEVDAAVLDNYTDAANVSDWAAPAFAWAVENGIITGMTETTLAPQGNATRAQVATILMRFAELSK